MRRERRIHGLGNRPEGSSLLGLHRANAAMRERGRDRFLKRFLVAHSDSHNREPAGMREQPGTRKQESKVQPAGIIPA